MRVMALDVGEKTVGVAVSDPLGMFATPRETLKRDGLELEKLLRLIADEEIGEVVVGMPLSLNGTRGPSAEMAQKFADLLTQRASVPVSTFDERLTTAQAERVLIAADTRREKRKKVIDQVAAAIILEGFLRFREFGSARTERDWDADEDFDSA